MHNHIYPFRHNAYPWESGSFRVRVHARFNFAQVRDFSTQQYHIYSCLTRAHLNHSSLIRSLVLSRLLHDLYMRRGIP